MKHTKKEMLESCISRSEARRINIQVADEGIDSLFADKLKHTPTKEV